MKKNNAEHVVFVGEGQEGYVLCKNCDTRLDIQLPLGIDQWVKTLKKFEKEHKDCKGGIV
jgi:hypothetical protein